MAKRTESTPTGAQATDPAGAPRRTATNALEEGRRPHRSRRLERRPQSAEGPGETQRTEENSIQPARRQAKGAEAHPVAQERREAARKDDRAASRAPDPGQAAPASSGVEASPERSRWVPEPVRKRFVQVGKHYYFADGARAFSDRGRRLTTPSENTEVIRSLVAIAEARGWREITVRGTERFRKDAWQAARLAGLEVRGYRPTEFEQARIVRALARATARSTPEASHAAPHGLKSRDSSRGASGQGTPNKADPGRQGRPGGLLTGTLVDHGRATYRHDPREPMSYFVTLETPRGDRTLWGVDLERALKESLSRAQIGDEVGLRAVRQEPVKVRSPKRDAAGKVVGEQALETHRNRWRLEKRAFFEARAEAARTLRDPGVDPKHAVERHPELVGTYLQVHAAELAAKQFRDRQDQERFVRQVRSALADAVARGEPLPPVRLREPAAERAILRARKGRDRLPARARE